MVSIKDVNPLTQKVQNLLSRKSVSKAQLFTRRGPAVACAYPGLFVIVGLPAVPTHASPAELSTMVHLESGSLADASPINLRCPTAPPVGPFNA